MTPRRHPGAAQQNPGPRQWISSIARTRFQRLGPGSSLRCGRDDGRGGARESAFRSDANFANRPIADLDFLPERPHAIGDFRGREPHLHRPANTADLVYLEVQLRGRRSVLREPDLTCLSAPFVFPDRKATNLAMILLGSSMCAPPCHQLSLAESMTAFHPLGELRFTTRCRH